MLPKPGMAVCEFCGWECDEDCRACPKCHEYKGLIRWRDRMNDPTMDAKIEAAIKEMEADPEYQGREP
jgi:hypothetical protein